MQGDLEGQLQRPTPEETYESDSEVNKEPNIENLKKTIKEAKAEIEDGKWVTINGREIWLNSEELIEWQETLEEKPAKEEKGVEYRGKRLNITNPDLIAHCKQEEGKRAIDEAKEFLDTEDEYSWMNELDFDEADEILAEKKAKEQEQLNDDSWIDFAFPEEKEEGMVEKTREDEVKEEEALEKKIKVKVKRKKAKKVTISRREFLKLKRIEQALVKFSTDLKDMAEKKLHENNVERLHLKYVQNVREYQNRRPANETYMATIEDKVGVTTQNRVAFRDQVDPHELCFYEKMHPDFVKAYEELLKEKPELLEQIQKEYEEREKERKEEKKKKAEEEKEKKKNQKPLSEIYTEIRQTCSEIKEESKRPSSAEEITREFRKVCREAKKAARNLPYKIRRESTIVNMHNDYLAEIRKWGFMFGVSYNKELVDSIEKHLPEEFIRQLRKEAKQRMLVGVVDSIPVEYQLAYEKLLADEPGLIAEYAPKYSEEAEKIEEKKKEDYGFELVDKDEKVVTCELADESKGIEEVIGQEWEEPKTKKETKTSKRFEQPPIEQLDKYEVLEQIGKGGFCDVYKAKSKTTGKTVCLKVLRDNSLRDAWIKHLEITKDLDHFYILQILDASEKDSDKLWISVPYLEEGHLNTQETRTLEQNLELFDRICGAIAYAHRQGVVHRDIKPQNILISGKFPQVTDFGIAASFEAENTGIEASLLTAIAHAGTMGYIPPEQLDAMRKGEQVKADPRSDIYNLGVLLYEMLTGELPGKNITQELKEHRVDSSIIKLINKATARNPEKRYQTVIEMNNDLEKTIQLCCDNNPITRFRKNLLRKKKGLDAVQEDVADKLIRQGQIVEEKIKAFFDEVKLDFQTEYRSKTTYEFIDVYMACRKKKGKVYINTFMLEYIPSQSLIKIWDRFNFRHDDERKPMAEIRLGENPTIEFNSKHKKYTDKFNRYMNFDNFPLEKATITEFFDYAAQNPQTGNSTHANLFKVLTEVLTKLPDELQKKYESIQGTDIGEIVKPMIDDPVEKTRTTVAELKKLKKEQRKGIKIAAKNLEARMKDAFSLLKDVESMRIKEEGGLEINYSQGYEQWIRLYDSKKKEPTQISIWLRQGWWGKYTVLRGRFDKYGIFLKQNPVSQESEITYKELLEKLQQVKPEKGSETEKNRQELIQTIQSLPEKLMEYLQGDLVNNPQVQLAKQERAKKEQRKAKQGVGMVGQFLDNVLNGPVEANKSEEKEEDLSYTPKTKLRLTALIKARREVLKTGLHDEYNTEIAPRLEEMFEIASGNFEFDITVENKFTHIIKKNGIVVNREQLPILRVMYNPKTGYSIFTYTLNNNKRKYDDKPIATITPGKIWINNTFNSTNHLKNGNMKTKKFIDYLCENPPIGNHIDDKQYRCFLEILRRLPEEVEKEMAKQYGIDL